MQNAEDIRSLLRGIDYFDAVSDEDLDQLIAHVENRSIPPGQTLIAEGEAGHFVWVLIAGSLGIFAGGEEINRMETCGAVFGEISAVSQIAATASVRSLEDVRVLAIPQKELHRIMEKSPEFAASVLRSMAKYLGSR